MNVRALFIFMGKIFPRPDMGREGGLLLMTNNSKKEFDIIIVGGGPVGVAM